MFYGTGLIFKELDHIHLRGKCELNRIFLNSLQGII